MRHEFAWLNTLVSSDTQRALKLPVFFCLGLPLSSLSMETSTLEPNPASGSREQLMKLLQMKKTEHEYQCSKSLPVRHEVRVLWSVEDWPPLDVVPPTARDAPSL